MSQNIYDNPDFFAGYATLPAQQKDWTAHRSGLPCRHCCRHWPGSQ